MLQRGTAPRPGPLRSKVESKTASTSVASSDLQNQAVRWALPVAKTQLKPWPASHTTPVPGGGLLPFS